MMKKSGLFGLVLIAFICLHCSEAEDPDMACPVVPVEGSDDDITGKWKLMKTHQIFTSEGPITTDESCNNTVLHFQADDTLTVSSDKEDYPFSLGPYTYELSQTPLYAHDFTLKIGNRKYACSIFEGNMILDNSPLDGPIRYFIRIQ